MNKTLTPVHSPDNRSLAGIETELLVTGWSSEIQHLMLTVTETTCHRL
jgi:hypothetical protein